MPKKSRNPRKRVIGYIKAGLVDAHNIENLIAEMEKFCRRHRLVLVDAVVSEASSSQVKLRKLLASIRSKRHAEMIVTPSFVHFSELPKLLHRLNDLHAANIGVVFQRENIQLRPRAFNTRNLYAFAESYVSAQQFAKSQNIKSSLKLAALYGRTLGKPRLPANIRKEAERHLRNGLSLREVVKKMGSDRISRSSVANVRREMKKRDSR